MTNAALPEFMAPGQPVRCNPETGRWFITIGQPGFNSRPNNGAGYATEAKALAAIRFYSNRGAK